MQTFVSAFLLSSFRHCVFRLKMKRTESDILESRCQKIIKTKFITMFICSSARTEACIRAIQPISRTGSKRTIPEKAPNIRARGFRSVSSIQRLRRPEAPRCPVKPRSKSLRENRSSSFSRNRIRPAVKLKVRFRITQTEDAWKQAPLQIPSRIRQIRL